MRVEPKACGAHSEEVIMTMLRTAIVVTLATAFVTVTMLHGVARAKSLEDYISEATNYQQQGDLAKAFVTMGDALKEYPDDATVYAYLGLYRAMQAGEAPGVVEAGRFSNEAYTLLDKAVQLDPNNPRARLYRGLLGVNMPDFMGKLDGAIADLEWVTVISEEHPASVSQDMLVTDYELLGSAYQRKGERDKAEAALRKVIELAAGTDRAKKAEQNLATLLAAPQAPPKPPARHLESAEIATMIAKAQDLMDKAQYTEAVDILKQVIQSDSTNAQAYKMLGSALAYSDVGYNKQIEENTALRTNLVFESMNYLDKAVSLAPDDVEARLFRGIMGVSFPFFVGKLDQGIDDLTAVMKSNAPADMKAQAKYWLGFAYQKKGMTYWTEVVNENVDTSAVRMALEGMKPRIEHFDRSAYPGPIVVVDFVLGLRDELPPQVAVWVEDDAGDFVRTLYVSGFSGNAKSAQVVLPDYADASSFKDADAVTGASIDIGDHVYVWDLKDASGSAVKDGGYTMKVESSWWPSMKYELTSATVEVGKRPTAKVVKEGTYIPYLEVRYTP